MSVPSLPRVLVTGAGGFVGQHLMRHLKGLGYPAEPSPVRLPDRSRFASLLSAFRPDTVIHLAAVSFLPEAHGDPGGAVAVNLDGTRSVLEALHEVDPGGKTGLVFVSSAHVYDNQGALPFSEKSCLGPDSAYGRTKLAAELLCRIWCDAVPPRPLVVFRPFNHTGPGQGPEFAASSFASQVALIEGGKQDPVLRTGDLSVRRDFCDVRDVVRAYSRAAAGEILPGTYNLASGRSVALSEIAEHYRLRSRVPFRVEPQTDKIRPSEIQEIRGSAEKIRKCFGWKAEIPLARTLDDLLSGWRGQVNFLDPGQKGIKKP